MSCAHGIVVLRRTRNQQLLLYENAKILGSIPSVRTLYTLLSFYPGFAFLLLFSIYSVPFFYFSWWCFFRCGEWMNEWMNGCLFVLLCLFWYFSFFDWLIKWLIGSLVHAFWSDQILSVPSCQKPPSNSSSPNPN